MGIGMATTGMAWGFLIKSRRRGPREVRVCVGVLLLPRKTLLGLQRERERVRVGGRGKILYCADACCWVSNAV